MIDCWCVSGERIRSIFHYWIEGVLSIRWGVVWMGDELIMIFLSIVLLSIVVKLLLSFSTFSWSFYILLFFFMVCCSFDLQTICVCFRSCLLHGSITNPMHGLVCGMARLPMLLFASNECTERRHRIQTAHKPTPQHWSSILYHIRSGMCWMLFGCGSLLYRT